MRSETERFVATALDAAEIPPPDLGAIRARAAAGGRKRKRGGAVALAAALLCALCLAAAGGAHAPPATPAPIASTTPAPAVT